MKAKVESSAGAARRQSILEAARAVFLRYGIKKTSMDDLARAAGLSRQGLYLHFQTKEELFKAVVLELASSLRTASRAALAAEGVDLETRIVDAFDASHGKGLGQLESEHMAELFAAAEEHVGDPVRESEAALVADVAKALRTAGIAAHWKDAGLSANELAATLHAVSSGLEHSAASHDGFRDGLRSAVRLVCRGGARG